MGYRVFISCGQRTDEERRVGEGLHGILTAGGHAPFFAGKSHSFDELASHLFASLADCEAYVAVLHPRGEVHYPGIGKREIRGSVWIHQELAILAYRRFLQGRSIPLCVLMEKSIHREGVLDTLIVNPESFQSEGEVFERVKEWMHDKLVPDPLETARERLFRQHTKDLDKRHWWILLLCVLHARPTDGRADRDQVMRDFKDLAREASPKVTILSDPTRDYGQIENHLVVHGLLESPIPDPERRGSASQLIAIRPAWADLVMARLRERGELLK